MTKLSTHHLVPMGFLETICNTLPELYSEFGPAFHVMDGLGIIRQCSDMQQSFSGVKGYQNFYAVKANDTHAILELISDQGFGFDCSHLFELHKAIIQLNRLKHKGANVKNRIMYTSNNTSDEDFIEVLQYIKEGVDIILNIDDFSMIERVAKLNGGKLPDKICLRYNPGDLRDCGSEAAKFGNPGEQKYGVMDDQIIKAYRKTIDLGAKELLSHTMIASGTRDVTYIQGTIEMLLNNVVLRIYKELGVKIKSINMGGGIGIPYKPEHNEFPLNILGEWTHEITTKFCRENGFVPDFHMECGRCVVGPYGILVSKVRGIYNKGKKFVGLNVSTNANPRPKDYGPETDGYHHMIVVRNGKIVTNGPTEKVTIVGSLCENSDVFALDRELPVIHDGDTIIILCTGAHALKMGNRYNSQQLPGEIILLPDQSGFTEIRRPEVEHDHDATLRDLNPTKVSVS